MTLYRAGGDSPIARSLIRAAERGVQVAVLVELKARFDEATNVGWAKQLERAGVHVVYGLVGLKTHAKCVLVVRDDDDGLRRYCHIGTGNYNTKTARLYEDLGFLTCDPDSRRRRHPAVQPPHRLQPGDRVPVRCSSRRATCARSSLDLIEHETSFGESGPHHRSSSTRSPTPSMVEALYRPARPACGSTSSSAASAACAPGVPGLSENDPRAQHPRPLPGALPDLPLRPRRRRRPAALPHRLRRPDAAQPRPARRGARAGRAPEAPGVARPGVRVRSSPTTSCAGSSTADDTWHRCGPDRLRRAGDAQERLYRWVDERQRAQALTLPRLLPAGRAFTSRSPRPACGSPALSYRCTGVRTAPSRLERRTTT